MLTRVPFVEKDTEIQNRVRPTSASVLESLFSVLSSITGGTANETAPSNPGCVAVMRSRKDVVAVTCTSHRDSRVGDVYIHSGGSWIFPPLTHPSQEAGIHCLEWMPLSDVLLCGTSNGVAMWSLCALFERETDKSWVNLLPHPRGRPVHAIQVCPTGRMFAALSRGESDITVFDTYMQTASPLRCVRGSVAQEMAWSPSGKSILVGTHAGELVLFDADCWERNDTNVYELGAPAAALCWASAASCLVVPVRSLHIYTYTTRGGTAAAETTGGSIGVLQGNDRDSIQNYPVTMSPIPFVVDTTPFESVLETSSIPWRDIFISDLKAEPSSGLVAVSAACTLEDRAEIVVAPAVVIYLASLSPQLNMTVIRVISFDQFDLQGISMVEQQPISFEFRLPGRRSHNRAVSNATPSSSRRGPRGGGGGHYNLEPDQQTPGRSPMRGGSIVSSTGGHSSSSASKATHVSLPALVVLWNVGAMSVDTCHI